jgi:methylamine dehydrogenase accessory protein MauD
MHGWWTVSYVVLWVLVVVLALLTLALARQVGTLHLRLGPRGALEVDDEGPPLGEAPEPVPVTTLEGVPMSVGGPGAPHLLLFVSPGCPVCRDVAPSVGTAAAANGLAAVVVADAGEDEARHLLGELRAHSPLAVSPELARAYAVPGTPYAVVLDRMGVVRAKGTVNNLEQLEGLIDTARGRESDAFTEVRRR